jgi:hypothetical protein
MAWHMAYVTSVQKEDPLMADRRSSQSGGGGGGGAGSGTRAGSARKLRPLSAELERGGSASAAAGGSSTESRLVR